MGSYLSLAKYFSHRLTGGEYSLMASARHQEVISPAEISYTKPALWLDGQLDKVVAVQEETDWDHELSRIDGGEVTHDPTIAYFLEDVYCANGNLWGATFLKKYHNELGNNYLHRIEREVSKVSLCNSYAGLRYFGHWLRDDCCTSLLAEDDGTVSFLPLRDWPDAPRYMEILGLDVQTMDNSYVREMRVFQDYSQNSHKKRRCNELKARLRRHVTPTHSGGKVFLDRADSGAARPVSNTPEIIERLAREGFTVLDVTKDPLDKVLSELMDASLIVTMEGSQATHGCYTLADNGGLLMLQPPERFNNIGRDWTACQGQEYGFVVGDQTESGTSFDPEEILRTIDLFKT